MTKHLLRDLEHLKKEILGVGGLVETAIHNATTALLERRDDLARAVIRGDEHIDKREVAIEEECLKVLALHQPVAADLRFIIAVLKVNNDLERMGDLAANIAERALYLTSHEPLPRPAAFDQMVKGVRNMVRTALDSLVEQDPVRAARVLEADDDVDDAHRQMFTEMLQKMRSDPANIDRATQVLSVSRNLERIADQSTNIAEDVLFMVKGEISRHKGPQSL